MKNKKTIIIIILILIILALVNHIIYTEYYKSKQEKNETIKTKEVKKAKEKEKLLVKKSDESKDYIIDGEYVGDFSLESYTTQTGKTYNSKDLKAPYFNIDSTDANNANKEVNETYLNAVRIFNQGVNDKTTYIYLNYKKYKSDDVLSAVLKYEVGDVGITNPIYYTYNFDNTTGKLLTFKEAYTLSGFNDDNIDEKVKEAIKKEITKQMGNNSNNYPEGTTIDTYIDKTYSGYEDNKKYELIKYLINDKNKLSVVIDIRIPAQSDHLNTLLDIK